MIGKLVCVCLAASFLLFASTPVLLQQPDLMAYVQGNLPHKGVLKQTKEGFLYIELPREYVFALLPLLSSPACPPPYFDKEKVGAHITVATAQEMAELQFPRVSFLGDEIPFSIEKLAKVSLEKSKLGSEAYILIITSSKIAEIRTSLGLPAQIKGYDFHITIGVSCK